MKCFLITLVPQASVVVSDAGIAADGVADGADKDPGAVGEVSKITRSNRKSTRSVTSSIKGVKKWWKKS